MLNSGKTVLSRPVRSPPAVEVARTVWAQYMSVLFNYWENTHEENIYYYALNVISNLIKILSRIISNVVNSIIRREFLILQVSSSHPHPMYLAEHKQKQPRLFFVVVVVRVTDAFPWRRAKAYSQPASHWVSTQLNPNPQGMTGDRNNLCLLLSETPEQSWQTEPEKLIGCFPTKINIPYGSYYLFSLIWCFPSHLFFKVPFLQIKKIYTSLLKTAVHDRTFQFFLNVNFALLNGYTIWDIK